MFVIYFSAALGACFDMSLDENGKADFDKLGNSLESTLMDTDLVFEKIGEGANTMFAQLTPKGGTDAAQQRSTGGKAMQFPIFTAFGIGLYVLTKITGKKKFHRKGEEHGSARWANKKEINSLLDKPPKTRKCVKDVQLHLLAHFQVHYSFWRFRLLFYRKYRC